MKDKKATILIDLTKTRQQIFDKFSKDLRWGIRRAESEGLLMEEAGTNEDWKLFKLLFEEMWWSVTPKLDEMIEEWKQNKTRRLFFAIKPYDSRDVIAGFAVVKDLPDRLNMEYIAHAHDDYIKWRVNDFLYWKLIQLARQEGKPYFDLGGFQLGALGKTDKVNKYKEQFNGELVVEEVHGNFFYILGRKIVRRFPQLTRLKKKLQGYKFND